MKKVININFQGRVVMIEEDAYEQLKTYIESLRRHFAQEEGHEEIINDIESRVSELFEEVIKKGKPCVTEDDLNAIINSIGRPEDFEEDDLAAVGAPEGQQSGEKSSQSATQKQDASKGSNANTGAKSSAESTAAGSDTGRAKQLYRDENNKKIGGVCSGIANFFGIDPTLVRLVTLVLFCFYGAGIVAYIILWIAVPSSAAQVIGSSQRKLYRDLSNKTIGGVCAGLANYFEVSIWVPKVIFIVGAFFTFPLSAMFHQHFGGFFFPGINGFFITLYIILWLVVPPAITASEKLSMKGESVDLNTIKSSVQEDLQDGKKKVITHNAGEAVMVTASGRSSFGDFIVLMLKIFGYLILGSILITIVGGLLVAGVALFSLSPLKDYVIAGYWQNLYALIAVILLVWLPVVGIIIWIIRRLMKAKSSKGLRIGFISLWLIGLIAGGLFLASLYHDFKYVNDPVIQQIALNNGKVDKLDIRLDRKTQEFRHRRGWFASRDIAAFFADSATLNNTRFILRPSSSDSFTVTVAKYANGSSTAEASQRASAIQLNPILQQGNELTVPGYFEVNKETKFRNQYVLVTIGIPVGKKIEIHRPLGFNNRFYINMGFDDWDDLNMDEIDGLYKGTNDLDWDYDREYIMTENGLEDVKPDLDIRKDRIKSAEEIIEEQKEKIRQEQESIQNNLEEDKKKLQQQIEQQQELKNKMEDSKPDAAGSTSSVSTDYCSPVSWIGKSLLKIS